MITICFTYFRSLGLANLAAAMHSLRQQDLSRVEAIVVVDNNTADSEEDIRSAVDPLSFPVPMRLLSFKHGDASRTHSWSTNVAVQQARSEWVLFARADYLLDFDLVRRFTAVVDARPEGWNGFVTGHVYHLSVDIGRCEQTGWREQGPGALRPLPGSEAAYTHIDAGVWMARLEAFHRVGGLNESLTAWGHAQTHFQWKLHASGTEFVRIPEVLFYHPLHAAERDLGVAHQQLAEHGINLRELWARYEGRQPYA